MSTARAAFAISAATTLSLVLGAHVATGAAEVEPGAYCPFPKKGQTP